MNAADRWVRFRLRKGPTVVDRALRYLVRYAYRNVAYYHRAWKRAGVDVDGFRGRSDLPRLPITPREALLGAADGGYLDRRANPDQLFRSSTSGSTGGPVTVYLNRPEVYFRRASLLAAVAQSVRLRFPLTIVDVGALRSMGDRDLVQGLKIVRIVRLRRTMPLDEQVRLIEAQHPLIVQGRPSSLALLVEEMTRQGVRSVRPALVITGAEVLHPPVRELLERAFACRVADYYGTEEVGNVAWQCPHRTDVMHVNHDTCVLEVVDRDGTPLPAEVEGRTIVTNLYNCTMPFIRYDLGDRAALLPDGGACRCGYEGTSMQLTSGRDDDFFVLADGRLVSPRVVFQAVWDALPVEALGQRLINSVRTLQIVQEGLDDMVVRIVPGEAYAPSIWHKLEASVRMIHPGMLVRIEIVDELQADRSGKVRQVMSLVAKPRPSWAASCRHQGDAP